MNATWIVGLVFAAGSAVADGDSDAPDPACETRIRKLVEQLGDARYPVRESAQKALLNEGESILPILDKLGPIADAEVRQRLAGIRKILGRRELLVTWDSAAKHTRAMNAPPESLLIAGRVQVV